MTDIDIGHLREEARALWPQKMSPEQILAALMVVVGDVARYMRDQAEGKPVNERELQKELGNLIFSTIRWCDDLGYSSYECLRLAQQAQHEYVAKQQRTG